MQRLADVGAAVIGTGFIGTVHVEALRRIGVHVRGVLGSTPERGAARADALGVAAAYDVAGRAPRGRRGARSSMSPPPTTSTSARPGPSSRAGKHVVCEKPLAMTAAESAELVDAGRRDRPRQRHELQHPLLPAQPARRASWSAGGELGDVRLVTGRYFQDWLLLESDWNWRLQPERGGALRAVGDIGSHWLDLMTFVTGRHVTAVMAELATFIETRQEPTGPVETFSTERASETVEPRDRHRGRRHDPPPLRGRRARGGQHQPDQRRPEELAPVRDRWLRAAHGRGTPSSPTRRGIGHRDRPNEILIRNPALMGPAGQAAAALPGGHVEGFFDTFCAHFRAVYADVLAGAAGRPTRLSHVRRRPRRDARRRGHRRAALARAAGSTSTAAPPPGSPSPTEAPDEARPADRPVRGDAAEDVVDWTAANGFESIEIACWPPATGPTRRYAGTSHIDVANLSDGQAQRARRRDRGQGPDDLRPRLLPEPAPPRPGAPRRGHRPPQARHHRGREDGRPARQHVHGRRPHQDPGRELGGGAPRLAGHRRASRRTTGASSRSRTARCCSATTSGRAATTSRRPRGCGGASSSSGAARSGSTSTRRTCPPDDRHPALHPGVRARTSCTSRPRTS